MPRQQGVQDTDVGAGLTKQLRLCADPNTRSHVGQHSKQPQKVACYTGSLGSSSMHAVGVTWYSPWRPKCQARTFSLKQSML